MIKASFFIASMMMMMMMRMTKKMIQEAYFISFRVLLDFKCEAYINFWILFKKDLYILAASQQVIYSCQMASCGNYSLDTCTKRTTKNVMVKCVLR